MRRALVLFSGGLDSILATRILQEQGVEVEAVNFKTQFTCCQDQAGQQARALGVPLSVVSTDEEYLNMLKKPRFGYGRGANPCVDCRIYMFDKALAYLQKTGADFLASGEVVGQRPMSQKKRDLNVISQHSGADDLLLRPLSAKLLPPTLPEREGWVDRERLYDFCGRGRKGLIRLAKELGVDDVPGPSTGCALTEVKFSRKVFDLIQLDEPASEDDFRLLAVGRHFRFDERTKVVVGRHADENGSLVYHHGLAKSDHRTLLTPQGYPGPTVLLLGPATDEAIAFAGGLLLRYSSNETGEGCVELTCGDAPPRRIVSVCNSEADEATTIAEGSLHGVGSGR